MKGSQSSASQPLAYGVTVCTGNAYLPPHLLPSLCDMLVPRGLAIYDHIRFMMRQSHSQQDQYIGQTTPFR